MTIRSHRTFLVALVAPLLPLVALGPAAHAEAPPPIHDELAPADEPGSDLEDWELELLAEDPDLDLVLPSEAEIDRLIREGGTLRIEVDGEVFEEHFEPIDLDEPTELEPTELGALLEHLGLMALAGAPR